MHLTDLRVIQQQLASIRWRGARGKRFGQHFLTDRDVLLRIVDALEISSADTVLEIGPGLGVLTVELAARAKRVIAVEKDATLLPLLKQNTARFSNIEIVHCDALTVDPKSYQLPVTSYSLAGNLPYAITIPVIDRFILDSTRVPRRAVFLIQKEVAERFTDPPGGSARGAITVLLEAAAATELLEVVPATAFHPVPAVAGAIIRIAPYGHGSWIMDHGSFRDFVFTVFRHRRKQIGGILPKVVGASAATVIEKLRVLGINARSRPQELTLNQWRSLFDHFML